MKKTLKKFLAIVVAALMVFISAIPAMAEETTYKIEITNATNLPAMKTGQFEAYQIFSGEIDTASNQLINVEWNDDVIDSENLIKDLKAETTAPINNAFKDVKTAADVAYILEKNNDTDNHKFLQKFAELVKKNIKENAPKATSSANDEGTISTIKVSAPGYYFIDEVDIPTVEGSNNVQSEFILQVLGRDTTVAIKADIPTVDKKIVDGEDKVKGTTAEIGETITFELTGTFPADLSSYDTYKYIFHDKMSAALTDATAKSIVIYNEDRTTAKLTIIDENDLGKYFKADGTDITVTFADLKTLLSTLEATDKVVVTYTAKVQSANLKLGAGTDATDRNYNQVYIEYSNNPNASGAGDNSTGTTTTDTVYVYSFGVDITKVGNDADHKNGLEGAGFVLKNNDSDADDYGKYAKFTKNSSGEYIFDVWVSSYEDAKEHEDNELSGDLLEGKDGILDACLVTSDANGKIKIRGIDAGAYTLIETVVPNHYLKAADVTIKIDATIDANGALTSVLFNDGNGNVEYKDFTAEEGYDQLGEESDEKKVADSKTATFKSGIYSMTIEDKRIPYLPKTGGMGTTIFYIAGGLLIVGAAGYLIISSRKKRSEQK